jgi:hypothetical protein
LLFFLGNTIGAVHTGGALAGVLKDTSQFETNEASKAIQTASTTLLALGGAALSTNQWMSAVHDSLNNAGVGADITSTVLWTAFTTALVPVRTKDGGGSHTSRCRHRASLKTGRYSRTGPLVLAELLQFVSLFVPGMNPPSAGTGMGTTFRHTPVPGPAPRFRTPGQACGLEAPADDGQPVPSSIGDAVCLPATG